jgi:serine/threonine-protein kinase
MTPRNPPPLTSIEAAFPGYTDLKYLAPSGQKSALASTDPEGRRVALKLVAPSDAGTAYLAREIAIVRKLALPYVPEIYEHGDTEVAGETWHYVVEEFINGQPLNEALHDGPLSSDEVHRLTKTLLQGCAAFEQAAVVHRDIKPHNIIRGDDGRFWIIDFGLVRVLTEASLTPDARPFGWFTPAYGAPESIHNHKKKIDSKSDLFSVGLTIYESISGQNPHAVGKASILAVIQSIVAMDLPPLADSTELDRGFLDFVSSLCNRRRTARPANAIRALEVYLSDHSPL